MYHQETLEMPAVQMRSPIGETRLTRGQVRLLIHALHTQELSNLNSLVRMGASQAEVTARNSACRLLAGQLGSLVGTDMKWVGAADVPESRT